MVFSSVLATDIKTSIKNILNRDVIMVNDKGKPFSFEKNLPPITTITTETMRQSEPQQITVEDTPHLLVPIKGQLGTIGGIIVLAPIEEARKDAPIIKSFAELLVQQYLTLNKPVLDSTDQLISKIITNNNPSEFANYRTEAEILGYNFEVPRLAIIIHLHNFWSNCLATADQPSFEREEIIKSWKRTIEQKLSNFFTQTTDNIIAYIGNDKFIVFKAINGSDPSTIIQLIKKSHRSIFDPLKTRSITQISVGVSHPHNGIEGLIDSSREAELALTFGSKMWGEGQSHFFGDLGILSILGEGNREKELTFATDLLKNLTNPDFIETVEAFFDYNLNLTDTADALGIHRNTVIYRLNQVTNQIGLDPRAFDQALSIKLALLIKKLFQ